MGGIWLQDTDLLDQLIEIVGFKSGVVIPVARAVEWLNEAGILIQRPNQDSTMMRIRSEAVEAAVAHFSFKVGNISSSYSGSPSIATYHEYKGNRKAQKVYHQVQLALLDFLQKTGEMSKDGQSVDPRPFIMDCIEKYGIIGGKIALSFMMNIARHQQISPWLPSRSIDWKDRVELRELFESESLVTQYGTFIDQRFIDYLDRNFAEIDAMNWRKFEGLAGEWFEREGYRVDLGPGRNDDGIDLRLTLASGDITAAPLIIVQCKRQKRKIEKALVKSVYADILHERAESGVIVTSSELAPGAEAMRHARNYPIEVFDRASLRNWLECMRSATL